MPAKKSKKPSKLPKSLLLGIATNVAVGPLGFRAALDINPKDGKNPEPSRIVFRERESGAQEPPVPGPSAAFAVHDIEEVDRPARGNIGYIKQEGGPATEPKVPEHNRRNKTFGTPLIRADVEEGTASGFGPLKLLLGAISAAYANREEAAAVKNKVEVLLSCVASLDALFATTPGDPAERRRRDEVKRELKVIEGQLQLLSEEPRPWLVDHARHDEDVFGLLGGLREAIFHYQVMQRTRIDDKGLRSIDPAESIILDNLRCAQKAEYRHSSHGRCLRGTRRTILDEIELWTYDFHKPPVYWLNGLAGTGKSTIARTIAERTFADGRLGASFFCSRDFEDRRNLQFIFPTIATQLARRYTEFRSIFIPLVQSDPEVVHESLYGQLDKLIVQPLVKFSISTVIVIDALDECEDDEPASAILSVLGQFVNDIPKVKFFVTGRPEPRIRNGFRVPLLAKATDVFVLHEVEPGQVKNDIRLFYKHHCSEIKSRRQGLDGWPTEEQLDLLCERAAGLFVYAMATVRFIDQKNKNPEKQLDRLIQSQESGSEGKTKLRANTTLDSLYLSILHEAFGDDDPEDDPMVRSVLGAVIFATNPLSVPTIAALLGLDPGDVLPLLSSVHSLLILPEDIDQPVQSFHKSFPDFIANPARCANPRFCLHPPDQHTDLLVRCLELMNRKLERNMCKLPDGAANAEVEDLKQRVEQHIDRALEYACRSWHKHLSDITPTRKLEITPVLHRFLEEKFLFWLGVLSVLGAMREAVDALETTEQWSDVSRTLDLTRDYIRFILSYFDVISASAPHTYISALPLSPQKSIIRELYERYACPLARVVRGLPISWEPVLATGFHEDLKGVVAWSPCSKFIAVVKSTTVEILDAATLERLNAFKSLQGSTYDQLGFSQDSRTLTQFNQEKLISWDLQTGVPVGTVFSKGPDMRFAASSFVFSVDGKVLAVVIASPANPHIATYDLLSGTNRHFYWPPEGRIATPIWLHGEFLRFVTVKPGSIIVWEAAFTSIHTPAMVESFLAPNEVADLTLTNPVFLPALSQLAFTAKDTTSIQDSPDPWSVDLLSDLTVIAQDKILVWDARNSRFLLKDGPISTPSSDGPSHSMSFSSDGSFFSCGTSGGEMYVWKRSLAEYILHQKLAFPWPKPLLSPNGKSIITIDHLKIYLWHTRDQLLSLPSVPVHEGRSDFLLGFSPNEELAASARHRGSTVTVLDLLSGDLRLTIDTGMEIWCLGATGSAVVVAGEGKIMTWSLPAENHVNARASVNDSIHTTMLDCSDLSNPTEESISLDLGRIAVTGYSHSFDVHLQIHDMSTGRRLAGIEVPEGTTDFTLREHEVWYMDREVKGWKIIEDGESGITELEPLETSTRPPQVFPWQSRLGYEVTHDGWVLSPTQKRLAWLPHHWRSLEKTRVWGGRLLGLRQHGLSEVVILEFVE